MKTVVIAFMIFAAALAWCHEPSVAKPESFKQYQIQVRQYDSLKAFEAAVYDHHLNGFKVQSFTHSYYGGGDDHFYTVIFERAR